MFRAKHDRCLTKKSSQRTTRALGFENLEERRVMATTYVIMDFTPESHAGNLVDTFSNVRLPGGRYAPNFLDFNGDRKVNTADATLCAQRVASKVASFYSSAAAGFNVRFYYGDVTTQSNWGKQWINYGKASSNYEVAVMYFGGTNRQSGAIGMAPVAPNGYNFEGYGETYTRAIGNWMASNRASATASEFVDRIAQVAAHELGHMFGLQHCTSNMQNNVMNASQPFNAGAAKFLNQWANTPKGLQNAYQELRNSFRGQPQVSSQPALGGQWSLPPETADAANTAAQASLVGVDEQPQSQATVDEVFGSLTPDGELVLTDDEIQALAQAGSTPANQSGIAATSSAAREASWIKAADSVFANAVSQPAGREAERVAASTRLFDKVVDQKLLKKADRSGLAEDELFKGLCDDMVATKLPALV